MATDPFTGSFPLLFILTIFIAQFLIFASLMGIKWHCVSMYIHPITRNLGNFFTYLSGFLVFLSVNCSFIFAHFFLWELPVSIYSPELLIYSWAVTKSSEWHLSLFIQGCPLLNRIFFFFYMLKFLFWSFEGTGHM